MDKSTLSIFHGAWCVVMWCGGEGRGASQVVEVWCWRLRPTALAWANGQGILRSSCLIKLSKLLDQGILRSYDTEWAGDTSFLVAASQRLQSAGESARGLRICSSALRLWSAWMRTSWQAHGKDGGPTKTMGSMRKGCPRHSRAFQGVGPLCVVREYIECGVRAAVPHPPHPEDRVGCIGMCVGAGVDMSVV